MPECREKESYLPAPDTREGTKDETERQTGKIWMQEVRGDIFMTAS